ncbi:MerR family transcriptional regulator [Allonocardiopsis opalescens]|uniref:DNA-binding transcriptional MerR regulator n=1 Tax=Allonocardiopsis opalescens TaxID=1144618 RepID=A0A2T0PVY5_9ACTN|nr:MerR family transcriptional regulator [Allonocardiopsis opalescens]PRX95677.1 DNA-binding transcriptional MerR regulator [Allonocardiopsis opalescens]
MRIGELSRRTGVSERGLRYYEEQGLLSPRRLPSGYREFAEADVVTVRRIRSLLAAGLSTSVIARVLPCMDEDGEVLIPTYAEQLADLVAERDRISGAIADLQATQAALDAIIAAGQAVDLPDLADACPLGYAEAEAVAG